MTGEQVVTGSDGSWFEDGADRGRIVVRSVATEGAYSVLEWVVAPLVEGIKVANLGYDAHFHGAFEETFLVRSGALEFLIADRCVTLCAGDFVRVPKAVRHGYRNTTGGPVNLIVTFVPGGFEQLFEKYRTDGEPCTGPGFVEEAVARFESAFE